MADAEECDQGRYDYEYECMRADLLGLPQPKRPPTPQEPVRIEETEVEPGVKVLEKVEQDDEHYNNVEAGLDDLASILTRTQKKLNRFKTVCGSLKHVLKLKTGLGGSDSETASQCSQASDASESAPVTADDKVQTTCPPLPVEDVASSSSPAPPQYQFRLAEKMQSQFGALDSMLENADRSSVSMSEQNTQMRKFLN